MKIVRAIVSEVDGVTVFSPESGEVPAPIIIHQDEDGEYWYWTPED